MKLCPKLILEGTRLTHKTDLAFKLNEHHGIVGPRKYRYHSPLISAEWCAFTNSPWGRGLINFDISEEERAMKTYQTWLQLFQLLPYYSWIIDRFHISTILYQKIHHDRHYNFGWLEKGLAQLGFRLIFCFRRPETFRQARTDRLKISGNPDQYNDLSIFIDEQENIKDLIHRSRLKHLELDVSDGDIDLAADKIADWLKQTNGLYADY